MVIDIWGTDEGLVQRISQVTAVDQKPAFRQPGEIDRSVDSEVYCGPSLACPATFANPSELKLYHR